MNTTKTTKSAPAIREDVEGFSAKVRTALLASVAKGVGEVRVRVTDKDDRVAVRKTQKRVQGIGYNAGFNANFRVTLSGDVLTGKVVELDREAKRPGESDPTDKTPGTRSTFRNGWNAKKVEAWKKSHVPTVKGEKVPAKGTAKKTTAKKTTRKVTKVAPKVAPEVPANLAGVVGTVDTKTVTTTTK